MTDGVKPRLSPGHRIAGRYVVEKLIGRGGMGEVYVALDTKLGRKVALKLVAAAASSSSRRRLEAEAKAVASLAHPGIVTLHDVVEDGDAVVLVMELVQGTSLRAGLAAGPLPPSAVVAVVHGVAAALAAAHRRGLVHRDVKPDNVIVRPDGRTALLDFGVAKAVVETDDEAIATFDGNIIGTPAYLAPEQARGQVVSPATDQFALAITAFELLTGATPWPASVPEILSAILSAGPVPPPRDVPGGGKAVDAVFARALAKAPGDRFPSVTRFANELDVAFGGDPSLLEAETPPETVVTIDGPLPGGPTSASRDRGAPGATRVGVYDVFASQRRSRGGAATPMPISRTSRDRATWGRLGGVALVFVAAFGAGLLIKRSSEPVSTPAPETSAAAPSNYGLQPTGAASDAERGAFRAAIRALHIGELDDARRRVDALLEKNPGFSAAQLLRAYLSFVLAGTLDDAARAALRQASAGAETLEPRDAELLAALRPSFLDPPDWRETAKLTEAMTARRPDDVLAWEALGFAQVKLGNYAAAERAFRAEVALDAHAVLGHVVLGQLRVVQHDVAGGRRVLEGCLAADSGSARCRAELGLLLTDDGDCAGADKHARDALALDPTERRAFLARARATAGLGEPSEIVGDFLKQRREASTPERRAGLELEDIFALRFRAGDFPGAIAALPSGGALAGSVDDAVFDLARARALWEMGDREQAAKVAEASLRRVVTRRLPEHAENDVTGRMLMLLRTAGRISRAEHEKKREAWITSWRARRQGPEWAGEAASLWPTAYGTFDEPTPEDGATAVAAAAELGADLRRGLVVNAPVLDEENGLAGALLLAAGRDAEAEVALAAATRPCRLVPDHRAFLALGRLAEKKGDKARACQAYGEIERAWGRAKPKSVTLDAARAARTKLGCGG